jgi:hypothetical protein
VNKEVNYSDYNYNIPLNSTVLDLTPTNYPKKYQKFVSELVVLQENIRLSNELIDNSDSKGGVDEVLSSIIHSIKELERNLNMYLHLNNKKGDTKFN